MNSDQVHFEQSTGGYLVATREQLEALNKALTAGYQSGTSVPSNLTGGSALQMESLDRTLKSVTFQMKNLQLWPSIPMEKAYSTVEQFDRMTSVGSDGPAYFNEAGSPPEEDSRYVRDVAVVRYFGTRRRVSHVMTLVQTAFGDAVAREVNAGTMFILKNVERALYFGNADFSDVGEFTGLGVPPDTIAMDGLEKQIRLGNSDSKATALDFKGYGNIESVVRAMDGGVLTEEDLEEASLSIAQNLGTPTELHLPHRALADLGKQFYTKERVMPMGVPAGQAGFVLNTFNAAGGAFTLKPNVFLYPRSTPPTVQVRDNAPAATAFTGAGTSSTVASAVTSFVAGKVYQYKVTAANEMGESVASAAVTGTIVATGDIMTLTITNVANAKYYGVYRSNAGGAAGTVQFIGYVKQNPSATTTDFVDHNKRLPGSMKAFLFYRDPQSFGCKTLCPLSKLSLAQISTSIEFLLCLYITTMCYAPRQQFILENIGRA